eukprot:symbB.v1.2.016414.t1/scaffold1249.1/size128929/8
MVKKHKSSSRNDGWYDQLQAALLELITCRDVGDLDEGEVGHEPRPPCSWWECAEGDCGLDMEDRKRTRKVDHRRVDTSEVSTLEWSSFEIAHEAPSLLPPAPLPKPRVHEDELCPVPVVPFPRSHAQSGSSADGEKNVVEASPLPRLGPRLGNAGETRVKLSVDAAPHTKRMGPAMLCPAVPQKLGDHPAPSFQVGLSFLEPFSGLSTASSLQGKQTKQTKQQPGGMVLQVLLQNDRWVPLHFHRNDDLMRCACEFLEEHKLSTLVKQGLLNQLKQMVTMRQLSASVDVVDLL